MPEVKIPDSLPFDNQDGNVYNSEGRLVADVYEGDPDYIVHAANCYPTLLAALTVLVNAKALSGVRGLVAGWNGEDRPQGRYSDRHPSRLGATLPKTTCGAIYDLDEALVAARAALKVAGVDT